MIGHCIWIHSGLGLSSQSLIMHGYHSRNIRFLKKKNYLQKLRMMLFKAPLRMLELGYFRAGAKVKVILAVHNHISSMLVILPHSIPFSSYKI